MKKLRLKTPNIKLPNISRKVVYISAGVLVFLALFSFAVTKQVQAERQANVQAAQAVSAREAEKAATSKQIADLEAAVASEKQKNESICQWVRGVQSQRRLAVPPLCVVSNI